jgi:hypothetical protein
MEQKKRKHQIIISIDPAYAKDFHKRCIEYGVPMSKVLKDAIDNFMMTHQEVTKKSGDVV